jgi:Kef-type K+ transport system membrane component KefB
MFRLLLPLAASLLAALPLAAQEEHAAAAHGGGTTLLWIAIVLIAARISGLVERLGQPSVLGELVVGVVLGNLVLAGVDVFEPAKADPILRFLAELGVIILLFQIGLESNLAQMGKVGARALAVAVVGVVCPFVLGTWVVGPYLLPGLSFNAYMFVGAALTATSVGITARVFRDLGTLHTPEAQIVLGAAVIDDVMGLVILAVVSAIVTAGTVTAGAVALIVLKAAGFLVAAVVVGQLLAPRLGKLLSRLHTGTGMKFTLAISFALLFSYAAGLIGLAPIVGAFAAGLVLDPVHFDDFDEPGMVRDLRAELASARTPGSVQVDDLLHRHSHRHVEDLVEPLGFFLVPIFFVLTGMSVSLEALFDLPVLAVALGITAIGVAGKVVSGLAAGPVNKWVVGWGMVPRGEVGLIFATMGKQLGVLPEEEFAVIVIVVILTTLMTPPILSHLLRRHDKEARR